MAEDMLEFLDTCVVLHKFDPDILKDNRRFRSNRVHPNIASDYMALFYSPLKRERDYGFEVSIRDPFLFFMALLGENNSELGDLVCLQYPALVMECAKDIDKAVSEQFEKDGFQSIGDIIRTVWKDKEEMREKMSLDEEAVEKIKRHPVWNVAMICQTALGDDECASMESTSSGSSDLSNSIADKSAANALSEIQKQSMKTNPETANENEPTKAKERYEQRLNSRGESESDLSFSSSESYVPYSQ